MTIYVNNDEISSSLWPRTSTKFDRGQEHELRIAQDDFRCYVETDSGTIIRDPECIFDDFHFLSLDEIDSVS